MRGSVTASIAVGLLLVSGCTMEFHREAEVDFDTYRTARMAPLTAPVDEDWLEYLAAERQDVLVEDLRRASGFEEVWYPDERLDETPSLRIEVEIDISVECDDDGQDEILTEGVVRLIDTASGDTYRRREIDGSADTSDCSLTMFDEDEARESIDDAFGDVRLLLADDLRI